MKLFHLIPFSGHCLINKCLNKHKFRQNIQWLIPFIIVNLMPFITSNKICPTEFSDDLSSTIKAKWQSTQDIENEVVISDPACIDDNNNLVSRICINGTWYPTRTPKCQTTSSSNGFCPSNFQNIQEYCVYVSEPQEWKLTNNFSLPKQKKSVNLETEEYLWLPIKRVLNYGPFEYIDAGDNYGNPVTVNVPDQEFYSGDCMSFSIVTQKMQPENCTNFHRLVRHFRQDYSMYSCPYHCQPASLIGSKCYCKRRNKSCENFATISDSSNKDALMKVAGHEVCRIGEISTNFLSAKGAYAYLNGTVWQYGNFSTNCFICETKALENIQTNLVLTFEQKKRKLYLLVYTPEGIRHDQMKKKADIHCFTNSAKKQLKKKVKNELIFKYLHPESDAEILPYSFFVFKVKLEKYMGEYWCEAFTPKMSTIASNRIVAYVKKPGNEYSLRIVMRQYCKFYSCKMEDFYDRIIYGKLKNGLFRYIFNDVDIRIMEFFKIDIYNDFIDILLHLSTDNSMDVTEEYRFYKKELEKIINKTDNIDMLYFENCEFCLPETTQLNSYTLNWPLTKIGLSVVSDELCITEDGTPATRFCEGNFLYGAKWGKIRGYCAENTSISSVTHLLREALSKDITFPIIDDLWKNISQDLTVLDIYYVNKILSKIPELGTEFSVFAIDFINILMSTNETILNLSQNVLNLTDTTLELVDDILSETLFNPDSVFLVQKHNLILHIANPFLSNVSGFLLYGDENFALSDCILQNFNRTDNFQNISMKNLHLAAYLPEPILQQIYNETNGNISDIFLMTMIFYNDSLFIDNNYKSSSYVISVSIPGYGSYLQTPISILFRSNQSEAELCGFWDNGKRTKLKRGEWSVLGGNYLGKFNDTNLHMCSFIHLTHFALLVMSDTKNTAEEGETIINSIDNYNEFVLEVITMIGGSLSIIGIIGIFSTALLFEKWGKKIGTRILLNLSIAILLETVCIHLSEIKSLKESEFSCKIIGVLLHYIVLSKFCWMLIYAFLQYFRFVKVLGTVPSNLIIKSVIFSWGLPFFVATITGFATKQSYDSDYELCYPRDVLLYVTVLLPISLIIFANLTIFCIIMYNVSQTKTQVSGDKKMFKRKLYLALLLFFVLGIPWIFGILAELMPLSILKIILFYIFCITGTLQGFILFLFYVIINKETRHFWIHYIKTKKYY